MKLLHAHVTYVYNEYANCQLAALFMHMFNRSVMCIPSIRMVHQKLKQVDFIELVSSKSKPNPDTKNYIKNCLFKRWSKVFFSMKLLHAFVQYVCNVYEKYQIAASNTRIKVHLLCTSYHFTIHLCEIS